MRLGLQLSDMNLGFGYPKAEFRRVNKATVRSRRLLILINMNLCSVKVLFQKNEHLNGQTSPQSFTLITMRLPLLLGLATA